ncbi:MAG TPA: RpiB/LacA/LacB family sugar-phosphate isomerase [Candidatus Paceibacterota bacterium]|nr:RpiB/LacA/LacB family sugar-phosphate isomerase [Candidatus Paceibacterota bacterium]
MKIYVAADHAGFVLKEALIPYISSLGFEVQDCGAHIFDPLDDYPDYIKRAAAAVSDNPQQSLGIVIGGSGQGEAIVANKYPHVRAALYYGGNKKIVSLSREHNDANILSLGARFMTTRTAKQIVRVWLSSHHTLHARHKERISKIAEIEGDILQAGIAEQITGFAETAFGKIKGIWKK